MWLPLFRNRGLWLLCGLVAGLMLSGLWPHSPLHAVATDRYDTFAIATGPVDGTTEAVFFLDFLTGDLRGAVLNTAGKFSVFYEYNILGDLGVDVAKNPKYLMVTGIANLRQMAGRAQMSQCVVYVAESANGRVAAYGLPWSPGILATPKVTKNPFQPLAIAQFRTAAIRQPIQTPEK